MNDDPIGPRLIEIIEKSITAHPRSLQKMIGPSEIGLQCDRRILYKLAQVPEPPRPPAWKPTIGTATHTYLESVFDALIPDGDLTRSDWITEWQVTVGTLGTGENAIPITGHADLYHRPTGTVCDWKIVGPKQLTKYRLHGPSEQYRTQAMLYAKGFTESGGWEPARRVAIAFLPRDGELGAAYIWEAPYDPHIAQAALVRLNTLYGLLQILGLETAVSTKPICDDPWCPWCAKDRPKPERRSVFDPGSGPVTPKPVTTSQPLPGFGLPQTPQPRQSLFT